MTSYAAALPKSARPSPGRLIVGFLAAIVCLLLTASTVVVQTALASHASTTALRRYDDQQAIGMERTRDGRGAVDAAPDQAIFGRIVGVAVGQGHYDDILNLARTSARLDGYRLAPRATSLADDALTSSQRGQYLLDNWHPATFPEPNAVDQLPPRPSRQRPVGVRVHAGCSAVLLTESESRY